MRAFEVFMNGKRLCLAGVDGDGVLTTMLTHAAGHGRKDCQLRVGGLISSSGEHVGWSLNQLKAGDEVLIKIVNSKSADQPTTRRKIDPADDLKRQKRYVQDMAKKLGWKIITNPAP